MSNSPDDVLGTVTVRQNITRQMIGDLLSTADDCGGIDYWAWAKTGTLPEGVAAPEFFTDYFGVGGTWIIGIQSGDVKNVKPDGAWPQSDLDANGGKIVVPSSQYDVGEIDCYLLTADKVINGLQEYIAFRLGQGRVVDLEDMDEGDADCVLQFALFGEIVYS